MKSTAEVPSTAELATLIDRAATIQPKTPSHEQVKRDLGPIVTMLYEEKRMSFNEIAEWMRANSSTHLERSASYYQGIHRNWKALKEQEAKAQALQPRDA